MLRPLAGLALALAACSAAPPAPPTIFLAATAPAASVEPTVKPAPAPVRAPRALSPIAWETSEPAARERARRAGLPLVVFARAEWDAAGLEMERRVWTDPRVVAAARPFVALRLDLTAAEGDAERYAERYDVSGLPTTVLFDARGRRVAALFGLQDPERLVSALIEAAQ